MKILMVNSYYYPHEVGGAERSLRILAEALVQQGHEVLVATTGTADQAPHEVINGVSVRRFLTANLGARLDFLPSGAKKALWHLHDAYTPAAEAQIGEVCDAFQPDVVHTNNLSGFSVSVLGEIARRALPHVHTLRDYYLLCSNVGFFRGGEPCSSSRCMDCRILSMPKMRASRHIRHVVGNSQFIIDKHLAFGLFKHAKTSVVYNGYKVASPPAPRQHPGRSGRGVTFGFIGALLPTKGVSLLIDQFKHLIDETRGEHRLVIAGAGRTPDDPFVEDLKARSQGYAIEFTGKVKQQDFFPAVDVVVVPSLWDEPLSRVLFEAFANGVPTIASATGGSPELIQPGVSGWLFNTALEGDLKRQMEDAIQNAESYERISQHALSQSARYDPDHVVAQYLAIYKSP